jgi:hypothetical protein
MDDSTPLIAVTPNRAIPKVLGILSIVFASLLLLGSGCQLLASIMSPALSKAIQDATKKVEEQQKAKQAADVKKIEEEEKAAKTEDEKAELRDLKKAMAAPPAPAVPMIDISRFMTDPMLNGWVWFDHLTALFANIALLVAGIGLVCFKPWGRTLGIWTAVVKIIRLALVYGYCAIYIVPPFAKILGEEVGKMFIQQAQAGGRPVPPNLTPEFFTRIYVITYSIMCVAMIVFGSIYPAVMIWLLNKRSAKAALAGTGPLTKQAETW